MLKIWCFSLVLFCALFVIPGSAVEEQCTTLSCIHSSATMIELLDQQIKPCEDFYEYACGNFELSVRSADEETTFNTFALVSNNVIEYLLNLLLKEYKETDPRLNYLSKKFYKSCLNSDVDGRSKMALLDILKTLNVFPMMGGTDFDEKTWSWKNSLLKLRSVISNKTDNIFKKIEKISNMTEEDVRGFSEKELQKIKDNLKPFMADVVRELTGLNSTELSADIDKLFEFEDKLADFFNKNKAFPGINRIKVDGFKPIHKRVLWMETFSPSNLERVQKYNGSFDESFIQSYHNFINNTTNRTLANYVGWRVIQASIDFMHTEMRNVLLKFQKDAFGKEDVEQRWKLCAVLTQNTAAVATGALYIDAYFKEADKNASVKLVNNLLVEYMTSIEKSDWMDLKTRQSAKHIAMSMKKFIGYADELRTDVAIKYYDDLFDHPQEKFLEMGLAFKIFETDREYRRLIQKSGSDWAKYSKSATVNAYYKSEDNSIQFPAAILQSPNFDKDRSPVMNFGAIGAIIGHEMTHAFDNLANNKIDWSNSSIDEYVKKVKCIEDQYNNYHVEVVERDFELTNFTINGTLTLKENIADCGGVKLAYNAFKKWSEIGEQLKPVGMENYSNEQIFWISFAQTYCSIENSALLKKEKYKNIYSADRFRVVGPIHNMPEFAAAFNCPAGTPMNPHPDKRCTFW